MDPRYWRRNTLQLKLKSLMYGLNLSIQAHKLSEHWSLRAEGNLRSGPVRSPLELSAEYNDEGKLLRTHIHASLFNFQESSQNCLHAQAIDPLLGLYYCLWSFESGSQPIEPICIQVGSRLHELNFEQATHRIHIFEGQKNIMTWSSSKGKWQCQLNALPGQPNVIVEKQAFSFRETY